MARLNLIVLRAHDADRLARFYSRLGLSFERHRHGNGPEHYACQNGGGTVEIYPLAGIGEHTRGVRLGFEVADVCAAVAELASEGGQVLAEPRPSPWGLRAVVKDTEGHRVELVQAIPA